MFGQIRQYYRYLIVLSYIDPGTGYVISGITAWLISILAGFFAIFSLFFKRIFGFLKKDKRISGGILLLIIILGLVIRGVTTMKKITKFNKRIVILGFDGLSPSLIEPMMAEGKLPNFSHLKKIGSYKQILSTNPPQSPVAWSGFSTGKNPGKNGVYDFIVRDPKNYNLALSFSKIEKGRAKKVLKTKSLWHYASQVRVPLVILSLPVTFPPDKVYGRMLSGMGIPDILGTEGTFTFYTSEKLETGKDMGGKVFQVKKSPLMVMYLIGPRV
ncbi:MAG: alkaline phosphatase family protein, partial [Candidatus Omnitrophica bacterium]|nr:alkaline phosphatase family protein [Candidatus Omnitrophota bacterium]